MSEAQAAINSETQKSRGFGRIYRLFRPSTADVRRKTRDKPHAQEPSKSNGFAHVHAPEKERFIPVTRFAILNRLCRSELWLENEHEAGKKLLSCLSAWRHQTYHSRLMSLKESYLAFSPDRDTVQILKYTPDQLQTMRHDLMEKLGDLLESANYEKVTEEDLDLLLASDSPYGLRLHVDLDAFDDVVIYFRGAGTKPVQYRDIKWAYLRKKTVETPMFQRLFVALKLKPEEDQIHQLITKEGLTRKQAEKLVAKNRKILPDGVTSDHVYLKLFKNIPQDDLEMLFPNTKVEFKLFDKLKLGLTAGGGTVAGLVGIVPKLFAAATLLNPVALISTFAGFIGLVVRQVMKFFNQRNEYMMTLAQNLYFHNLANNRGVLTLLVDRAEEEDIKEEMLLYNYLSRTANGGIKLDKAKADIEAFLQNEFNINIDFDIEDGFLRLIRDGLVEKTETGSYEILPPARAAKQVERLWRSSLSNTELASEASLGSQN